MVVVGAVGLLRGVVAFFAESKVTAVECAFTKTHLSFTV